MFGIANDEYTVKNLVCLAHFIQWCDINVRVSLTLLVNLSVLYTL